MKLEKKHYVIIAVVIAIIAVWYFFLRKKTTTTTSKYAGEFGSFGNESGYSERLAILDANLPMIGESGYAKISCPPGFVMSGGKCVIPKEGAASSRITPTYSPMNPPKQRTVVWECKNKAGTVVSSGFGSSVGPCPTGSSPVIIKSL